MRKVSEFDPKLEVGQPLISPLVREEERPQFHSPKGGAGKSVIADLFAWAELPRVAQESTPLLVQSRSPR